MIFIKYLNKVINVSRSFKELDASLEPYRYDNIHLEIAVERDSTIDAEILSHGIEDIDAFLHMLSRCNLAPHEDKVLKKFDLSFYVNMHKTIVLSALTVHNKYVSEKAILKGWCVEKLDPTMGRNFLLKLHKGLEKINEFDMGNLYKEINNLDDEGKKLYVQTLMIS